MDFFQAVQNEIATFGQELVNPPGFDPFMGCIVMQRERQLLSFVKRIAFEHGVPKLVFQRVDNRPGIFREKLRPTCQADQHHDQCVDHISERLTDQGIDFNPQAYSRLTYLATGLDEYAILNPKEYKMKGMDSMNKELEVSNHEIESLANVLAERFIQRRDLYSKQLDDGRYLCIRKPLKDWHLAAHLRGEITLGAYVLDENSKTRYIVFDADDDIAMEKLVGMALDLEADGIPAYLEQSRRGGHLWLFFGQPVMGRDARAFAKGLVDIYELENIELFPKQSKLKEGPGSLIRLPFGVHRKTGERYDFITPSGNPLAPSLLEQIQLLSTPQSVSMAAFSAYRKFGTKTFRKAEFVPTEAASGTLSQRIKESVTAVDFISQFVELSADGRGLCPFHEDNRHSFAVNAEKNYWNCFAGCGGGDIIHFWEKWQGIPRGAAIRELSSGREGRER